jgi:hypothetical protein
LLTFSRAQTGASSTALLSDNTTWATYAADVPRFHGSAQRLLIEGQRTNEVRNPRAEGAVTGSPGTMPTHWSTTLPTGVSREVVGYSTRNGIPGIELRFFGTVTSGANVVIDPETTTAIAATPSQQWTASCFAMLVAGSMTGFTNFGIGHTSRNSGGSSVSGNSTSTGTLTGTVVRLTKTHTTSSDPSVTYVQPRISGAVTVGATLECTIWLAVPQMEQAAFASTPILPPAGTPGASTRGADIVSASLTTLGFPANGACTILWRGSIPQNAPSGISQSIAAINDGSTNNMLAMLNGAGGSSILPRRVLAGSAASGSSAGSMVAGTPFNAGMTCSNGRVAVSFNGNTPTAVTGGPTSGLSLFSLGGLPGGQSMLFGTTELLRVMPYEVSDATLAALVAALPT